MKITPITTLALLLALTPSVYAVGWNGSEAQRDAQEQAEFDQRYERKQQQEQTQEWHNEVHRNAQEEAANKPDPHDEVIIINTLNAVGGLLFGGDK